MVNSCHDLNIFEKTNDMNPLWTQVIIQTTLRYKHKRDGKITFSEEELAEGKKDFLISARHLAKDLVLIVAGIFSAAFGFKGFLLTNHFIDGGATGISLLLSVLTGMQLQYFIILINIPFIVLAYVMFNWQFAIKTTAAIIGLAICLALVEFPDVTKDNLLVAAFGGFFLGAGIGLAMRGGAVIDGTEVLAIYLSKKLVTTVGDIIILINIVIFSLAAYLLSVEIALYSMITYLAASKTLDFVIEGIEEYIGVTIISAHSEKIREMIVNSMGRGVTVYHGRRGFGKRGEAEQTEIIYSVVTRLEINRLTIEIEKIDPTAFVVMNSVKDTKGGMIKKRPLKD
jgi:uncharacterized membrane-anchored protein YitT (DUF2179 family)